MNILQRSILSIIFYSVYSLPLVAGDYPLTWIHKEIDDQAVLQFKDLNENQIVEQLRKKYGIKVLILNKKAQNNPMNTSLTIRNEEIDEAAVSYYEADEFNQTAIKVMKTPLAEFIGPHFHVHEEPSLDVIARPYMDQPIILLTQSATRMAIIHEFVHYYLCVQNPKDYIRTQNGIQHHRACIDHHELLTLHERMMEAQNVALSLPQNTTQSLKMEKAESFYLAMIEFYLKLANVSVQREGKEVDVHRFMYEHREMLKLSEDESINAFGNVGRHLNALDEALSPLVEDPNLKILARDVQSYSQVLQNKHNAFLELRQSLIPKMQSASTWYNRKKNKQNE
ncbi:MAG: hypothetical protein HY390_01815 [Deltaproteobacteria bacterium]|nr:hypothetical protein [Deltaproteobacteria bacterium]